QVPSAPRAVAAPHAPHRVSPSAFFVMRQRPPGPPLFPYTTLFRSDDPVVRVGSADDVVRFDRRAAVEDDQHLVAVRSRPRARQRSEEHTSELQSRVDLVCRLLLEKKKQYISPPPETDTAPGRTCPV